jgi:hypothetical protein
MTKNNKPVLSILIDKDKRDRFVDFSRRNNLSMGYLVNQAIDRLLAADSMDIYRDSKAVAQIPRLSISTEPSIDSTDKSIDEMIRSALSKHLDEKALNIPSTGLSREDVEELIETSIGDVRSRLEDIEEFTRNLQGEISEVKKAFTVVDSTPIDSPVQRKLSIDGDSEPDNIKTWGEFFKMVEIEALAAVDAQKKENVAIRTKQIEMGLQAAMERGLGKWRVNVAGRSFVRVTPPHA